MARALSVDLRRRVVDAIAEGMSRRQAAARFGVSASSAIRWAAQLARTGAIEPKQQGGDRRSHRIDSEAAFILETVEQRSSASEERTSMSPLSAALWRASMRSWRGRVGGKPLWLQSQAAPGAGQHGLGRGHRQVSPHELATGCAGL
jgi:transposase